MTYIGKRCLHGIDSATCFYCKNKNLTPKQVENNHQKFKQEQKKKEDK